VVEFSRSIPCGAELMNLAEDFRRASWGARERTWAMSLLKGQKTYLVSHTNMESLRQQFESPELLKAMEAMKIRSYIVLPLTVRDQILGSLYLISSTRSFTEDDAAFLEEIARRTSISLDNARLFQKQEEAVRSREDVVQIVSHDLKNPLFAIQMGVEIMHHILDSGLSTSTEQALRTRLEGIARANDQAVELIR